MIRKIFFATVLLLLVLAWATAAQGQQNGVIVRTSLDLAGLQALCLVQNCSVVPTALDGTLNQVFLLTTPLNPQTLINILVALPGIIDAEVDQILTLVTSNLVPLPLSTTLMSDRSVVPYPSNSPAMVWNSYANQSAAGIVEVQTAQSQFNATGTGIVADIDTGVDPQHPALQGVLLPGYDFTRNQSGGSEMNDLGSGFTPPSPCDSTTCPSAIQVNQSSAAILDQSSAAILDTNPQYAAFGHGTMVLGVIHLVAPTAQLMPLKVFQSNGSANLSDILRAIYYAVQNNANAINMSFDTKTSSTELQIALDYANQLGVVCVSSAGNDGMQETVYPAALQSEVMGVASVGSTTSTDDTRSSFSNFGTAIVWVAAPGEQIVTTYPFSTYAAGWGTSFSAPFVTGAAMLARGLKTPLKQSDASAAVANAAPLTDSTLGHGRLDLVPALQSLSGGTTGSPDFSLAAAPMNATVTAGSSAAYTITAAPANGFAQTITWSCSGAPAEASCAVTPASTTFTGSNSATATLTVTTAARPAALPPKLSPRVFPRGSLWSALAACLLWLVALFLLSLPRRQYHLVAAALLLAVSLTAVACGGSSYGSGGGGGMTPVTVSAVTVNPTTVAGGASSTGTVTLSGYAPSSGASVTLSSTSAAASIPASVTVNAGASSVTFPITTTSVSANTSVTITATYAGSSKSATLAVDPSGTLAGRYTLTITGTSGSLNHSATVQLTVN